MTQDHRANSLKYWDETHRSQNYDRKSVGVDDWLDRFADIIMPAQSPIVDIGCGGGNDTLYLIEKGKQVIPCDQSDCAIENIKKNYPEIVNAVCFNMLDDFPFGDGMFEVVIADLSLHYFREADTDRILSEIRRILVPGGHLIFRVNSVNDVNHGAGQGRLVERNLYETESGTLKRFFDEADINRFFGRFTIEYMNEEIMYRYKLEKWLFVGCVRR